MRGTQPWWLTSMWLAIAVGVTNVRVTVSAISRSAVGGFGTAPKPDDRSASRRQHGRRRPLARTAGQPSLAPGSCTRRRPATTCGPEARRFGGAWQAPRISSRGGRRQREGSLDATSAHLPGLAIGSSVGEHGCGAGASAFVCVWARPRGTVGGPKPLKSGLGLTRVDPRATLPARLVERPQSRCWGGIAAGRAEGEGFEPSVDRKAHNGFRDRPVQPLRHPSERPQIIGTLYRYARSPATSNSSSFSCGSGRPNRKP
jgi:hypothetical protein